MFGRARAGEHCFRPRPGRAVNPDSGSARQEGNPGNRGETTGEESQTEAPGAGSPTRRAGPPRPPPAKTTRPQIAPVEHLGQLLLLLGHRVVHLGLGGPGDDSALGLGRPAGRRNGPGLGRATSHGHRGGRDTARRANHRCRGPFVIGDRRGLQCTGRGGAAGTKCGRRPSPPGGRLGGQGPRARGPVSPGPAGRPRARLPNRPRPVARNLRTRPARPLPRRRTSRSAPLSRSPRDLRWSPLVALNAPELGVTASMGGTVRRNVPNNTLWAQRSKPRGA